MPAANIKCVGLQMIATELLQLLWWHKRSVCNRAWYFSFQTDCKSHISPMSAYTLGIEALSGQHQLIPTSSHFVATDDVY